MIKTLREFFELFYYRDPRGCKRCRWCGHKHPEITLADTLVQVQCPNCNGAGPGIEIPHIQHTKQARAAAIKYWNM